MPLARGAIFRGGTGSPGVPGADSLHANVRKLVSRPNCPHELLLQLLSEHGWALRFAPTNIRGDRELVKAVVTRFGLALEHASLDLKADPDVVRCAVEQNGYALKFASKHLQFDREIVLLGLANAVGTLEFADQRLRRDHKFLTEAVATNSQAVMFLPDSLRKEQRSIRKASSRNSRELAQSLRPARPRCQPILKQFSSIAPEQRELQPAHGRQPKAIEEKPAAQVPEPVVPHRTAWKCQLPFAVRKLKWRPLARKTEGAAQKYSQTAEEGIRSLRTKASGKEQKSPDGSEVLNEAKWAAAAKLAEAIATGKPGAPKSKPVVTQKPFVLPAWSPSAW